MNKVFFLFIICLQVSIAQNANDQDKMMREFIESRKKLIEKLHKSFQDDFFSSDNGAGSLFGDFDKLLDSDISSSAGQGFKLSEKEYDGIIEVTITPDENAKVEVENNGNSISINSTVTKRTTNSQSSSSYSRSVSAPFGYKVEGPENKGKDIVIKMIPTNKGIIDNEEPSGQGEKLELIEKEPIKKRKGEDTL